MEGGERIVKGVVQTLILTALLIVSAFVPLLGGLLFVMCEVVGLTNVKL